MLHERFSLDSHTCTCRAFRTTLVYPSWRRLTPEMMITSRSFFEQLFFDTRFFWPLWITPHVQWRVSSLSIGKHPHAAVTMSQATAKKEENDNPLSRLSPTQSVILGATAGDDAQSPYTPMFSRISWHGIHMCRMQQLCIIYQAFESTPAPCVNNAMCCPSISIYFTIALSMWDHYEADDGDDGKVTPYYEKKFIKDSLFLCRCDVQTLQLPTTLLEEHISAGEAS